MTNADRILRILEASDPLTISELADRLGVSRNSVTYSVNQLKKNGMIRMAGSKTEQRGGQGESFLWEARK